MTKQDNVKKTNSFIKWIFATVLVITIGIGGSFFGGTFYPNVWTVVASAPIVAAVVYYVKCKCGGWFKHKKDCEHKDK